MRILIVPVPALLDGLLQTPIGNLVLQSRPVPRKVILRTSAAKPRALFVLFVRASLRFKPVRIDGNERLGSRFVATDPQVAALVTLLGGGVLWERKTI